MSKFAAFVSTTLFMLNERLGGKDKGATMVEYGLIVAVIAVVVVVAATVLGNNVSTLFQNVAAKV